MAIPKVQWDGDEPYLALPSHPHIRITPYRDDEGDLAALERIANEPRIGKWSFGRPYPFTRADSFKRLDDNLPSQAVAVGALQRQRDGGEGRAETCPFSVVREDGAYVGDLGLWRGDGGWVVAYALDPEIHGRGVGTAAVGAVLAWAAAELDVRRVEATAQTANPASTGMLEKLGFVRDEVRMLAWPAHNGGGEREVAEYRREMNPPQSAVG